MRACVLLVLLLLASSTTALAQSTSRSATWQRYDADLVVQPDGSLLVTETQSLNFQGTYQQGFRVIPLDRTTGITGVSVAEMSPTGQTIPLNATSETDSAGLRVTWSFAPVTDASRTFILR